MDSFKNLYNTLLPSPRNLSESRSHYFFTILFTLILIIFFFSTSDETSPATSYRSFASQFHSSSNKLSPLSSKVFPSACFATQSRKSCTVSAALSPAGTCNQVSRNAESLDFAEEEIVSCDVFDGHWVVDEGFEPLYKPGSCPFVDNAFNCLKNGRPDTDYLRLKWKPHACEIPRF